MAVLPQILPKDRKTQCFSNCRTHYQEFEKPSPNDTSYAHFGRNYRFSQQGFRSIFLLREPVSVNPWTPTGRPDPSSCTDSQTFLTFHPDIIQDHCATSSCCSRKVSSTRLSTPYVGATGNPRTCGCTEQFDELCRSVGICRNPQRLAAFFQRQTPVLADGCAVCSEDK